MKSILIIDDSPTLRRTLRSFLERQPDWQVCCEGANGREGIDKALLLCPDLILLDLCMPVMNGFQAARELQLAMPKVPILLFTTFNDLQIEREARASGISAVKSKAENVDSLCRCIQELLA